MSRLIDGAIGHPAPLKVLLVAEGSGGPLIPALEVADALVRTGAEVKVWYATRQQTEGLVRALTHRPQRARFVVEPLPVELSDHPLRRVWEYGPLWRKAQTCFKTFGPDVVVGFGGWVSVPVVLAARQRRIGCLLHEQNVMMGRANRWLSRWVDRVAVSFAETQTMLPKIPSVVTGMPIRQSIGDTTQAQAADPIGISAERLTLLIVGGSQGSRSINTLLTRMVALLSPEERRRWQFVHVTGPTDEAWVRESYRSVEVTAWVAPFVAEMGSAYARADVVIARAGASTIAELARCGKPAILIPYPHAHGHQRVNAQFVQAVGGGLMIEESHATPERLLSSVRRILTDERLRIIMGWQMRALDVPDAAERLTHAILELSHRPLRHGVTSPVMAQQPHPEERLSTQAIARPPAGASSYVH